MALKQRSGALGIIDLAGGTITRSCFYKSMGISNTYVSKWEISPFRCD
ncbi:hypothetical protein [Novosphingobium sp. EMRT-2]|nr:hypothetical protein [Novosphingobium sp. EMRT-2]